MKLTNDKAVTPSRRGVCFLGQDCLCCNPRKASPLAQQILCPICHKPKENHS